MPKRYFLLLFLHSNFIVQVTMSFALNLLGIFKLRVAIYSNLKLLWVYHQDANAEAREIISLLNGRVFLLSW